LDLTLRSKNGIVNGTKMYIGVNHRDFDSSPFIEQIREQVFNRQLESPFPNGKQSYRPFRFLKNIMVDHCPNAFGCLLGLNLDPKSNEKIFTICYSGDTRPCTNLVQSCNHFTKSCGEKVSFLLHEATFDNDERGKLEAKKKRHATIEEAKHVASQMSVNSTLLTHFSQRYPKLPPGFDRDTNHNVGFAIDGMLIPLQNENLQQSMVTLTHLAVAVLSREK
jgi:ribonuclease BN (tRNA processing enzyme)